MAALLAGKAARWCGAVVTGTECPGFLRLGEPPCEGMPQNGAFESSPRPGRRPAGALPGRA